MLVKVFFETCHSAEGKVYLFDIERAVMDTPQVRQCKAVSSDINGKTTHVCHIVLDGTANQDKILKTISEYPRLK